MQRVHNNHHSLGTTLAGNNCFTSIHPPVPVQLAFTHWSVQECLVPASLQLQRKAFIDVLALLIPLNQFCFLPFLLFHRCWHQKHSIINLFIFLVVCIPESNSVTMINSCISQKSNYVGFSHHIYTFTHSVSKHDLC